MRVTVSTLLLLIAIIIFVLAALGVTVLNASELEEVSAGLAFGFASFLVP